MTATWPPEEAKPMQIDIRPNKRYRVQSRTRPEIKHLVKWIAAENKYSCSCEANEFHPERRCAHILEVEKRFAKHCQICGNYGEYEDRMVCPWDPKIILSFCPRCVKELERRFTPISERY